MKPSPYLSVENLCIGYDQRTVACIDSLNVAADEVVALIGPSGSGKTTLLASISGSLPILSGTINIIGTPNDRRGEGKLVSRTLQNFPLLHWLTVKENLLLSAKIKGVEIDNAEELLSLFQAEHLANKFPKTLSGGERCRASLAQALVSHPTLLLLDEPFAGLDVAVKEQVATALFNLVKSKNIPVLFVTHDLVDACAYSHRIVILDKGTPTKIAGIFKVTEPNIYDRVFALMGGTRHGV